MACWRCVDCRAGRGGSGTQEFSELVVKGALLVLLEPIEGEGDDVLWVGGALYAAVEVDEFCLVGCGGVGYSFHGYRVRSEFFCAGKTWLGELGLMVLCAGVVGFLAVECAAGFVL